MSRAKLQPIARDNGFGLASDASRAKRARLAGTRVCIVCGAAKPLADFAGERRTCTPCINVRLHKASTPHGRPPVAAQYQRYDGAELRPYENRPGAMDAYALPSLQMGKRVWRCGAAE